MDCTASIRIRVTQEQKEEVEALVNSNLERYESVSTFVRGCVLRRMREIKEAQNE